MLTGRFRPLLVILALNGSYGFQFMKNWKMPTYDPYEEAVKEKFGDKSEFSSVPVRWLLRCWIPC
jgi:hypothetical protein